MLSLIAILQNTMSFSFYAAGSDYAALVNAEVTFTSSSSQRQCILIAISDDLVVEPMEEFLVQLVQPTPQGTLSDQATVIITDGNIL